MHDQDYWISDTFFSLYGTLQTILKVLLETGAAIIWLVGDTSLEYRRAYFTLVYQNSVSCGFPKKLRLLNRPFTEYELNKYSERLVPSRKQWL